MWHSKCYKCSREGQKNVKESISNVEVNKNYTIHTPKNPWTHSMCKLLCNILSVIPGGYFSKRTFYVSVPDYIYICVYIAA